MGLLSKMFSKKNKNQETDEDIIKELTYTAEDIYDELQDTQVALYAAYQCNKTKKVQLGIIRGFNIFANKRYTLTIDKPNVDKLLYAIPSANGLDSKYIPVPVQPLSLSFKTVRTIWDKDVLYISNLSDIIYGRS